VELADAVHVIPFTDHDVVVRVSSWGVAITGDTYAAIYCPVPDMTSPCHVAASNPDVTADQVAP